MVELRRRNVASGESVKKPQKINKIRQNRESESYNFTNALTNYLKVMLFILVIPPMLNYAGLQKEKEFLKAQLTLFDVGFGQKMFMNCTGKGQPTVILDSPTGMTSDAWLAGQLHLASQTRVCIYDRAGLGFSDAAPSFNLSDPGEGAVARTLGPVATAVRMASDLHRLVTFSYPQEKPFILVGSEVSGLIARIYAHLHPQDISHLVLVDPISETLFDDVNNSNDVEKTENPWVNYWFGHLMPSFRVLQVAAMTGVTRLGLLTGLMTAPYTDIKETSNQSHSNQVEASQLELITRQKHHLCNPFHIQAVYDEHKGVNQSLAQMNEIRLAWPLPPNITTTIISGSYYDDQFPPALNRGWSRSVQDVIHRIQGSKHLVITGGDRHMIHKMAPETLAPVERLIKRWRSRH